MARWTWRSEGVAGAAPAWKRFEAALEVQNPCGFIGECKILRSEPRLPANTASSRQVVL